MRIVHNMFLFAYGEIPGLIRSTPAGDTERSEVVGRWVADWDAALHVHHESEDTLLWDRLEQRAPACARHVGQMRSQHAKVGDLLETTSPLLARWRASADPEFGEQLAAVYDKLRMVLKVHLRREVVEVMPVAAKVISQAEWDMMAQHGQRATPMTRALPMMGYFLASSPGEMTVQAFPPPIRVLYRLVGRRKFERQFRELFPGRPVPQN